MQRQSCPNCRRQNPDGKFCDSNCAQGYHFDQLIVCSDYSKKNLVRKLLLMLKYRFLEDVALILGRLMKYQFAYFSHEFEKALIVPIAIDSGREKMRGFNQAALLAKFLADSFSYLEFLDCLKRKVSVKKQVKLDKSSRLVNVINTMSVSQLSLDQLRGGTVILVDDVATTCSTLNEASRVLKNSGVKYVCGLTLARGHLFC